MKRFLLITGIFFSLSGLAQQRNSDEILTGWKKDKKGSSGFRNTHYKFVHDSIVKIGQSKKEVLRLLGKPNVKSKNFWRYKINQETVNGAAISETTWQIEFLGDRVFNKSGLSIHCH